MSLFQSPECFKEDVQPNFEKSKPRLNCAVRNQIEFVRASIDDLIEPDHSVRSIWNYVDQMDLSSILKKIKSTESTPGRPAIDPKILLTLWIYAIVEGIGSARLIERYSNYHLAFMWIRGGVSINYHTISDFRRNNAVEFDSLISEMIARLMDKNLITLRQISQDGMRVRAAAGTSSFRRKPKLKELLKIASQRVEDLRKEIDLDPSACLDRKKIAQKIAAEDKLNRVNKAIEEHKKATIEKGKSKKKHRKQFTQEEKDEIRSSTTDPEARKMKMGHGGFSPAYNLQIAIDNESRFIVGHEVLKKNNDYGELFKMYQKVKGTFKKGPLRWLVDQGYLDHNDIEKVEKDGCEVYVNPKKNEIRQNDSNELAMWRIRMGMDEAKEIYKDRAANSEWANAGMRNRGLRQFLIRGLKGVKSMFNFHVLTHNILRAIKLGYAW